MWDYEGEKGNKIKNVIEKEGGKVLVVHSLNEYNKVMQDDEVNKNLVITTKSQF